MRTNINKKQIVVWLPNKLFNNLKEQLDNYNEKGTKPKLNLAKAAYILNLLNYIPLKSEDKYDGGWIPVCSENLISIKNYKSYINFLKENGFMIEHKVDYSTTSNQCKRYKLGGTYGKQTLNLHTISDNSFFINKVNQFKIDRMNTADDKCNHLTKWLDPELLTIDSASALAHTRNTYSGKRNLRKKKKRNYAIKSIESKCWTYSREGKDDRLHSILTSLPKDLRQYVNYNGESLVSLDIKNSQPFIYSTILNQLIKPNINKVNGFIEDNQYVLYTSIMSDLFRGELNKDEIQSFIDQVMDGTFYEEYGKILYVEGLLSRDIHNHCYFIVPIELKDTWIIALEKFDTLRKASKHIILQTLFSSEKCKSKTISVFKKYYPEVYKITQFIKRDKVKNFFPILLQNIEADCILDYCTKKIADKYPYIPLFTIHDSIITTSRYKDILKVEFKKYLGLYFGLNPKLEPESWNEDLSNAS